MKKLLIVFSALLLAIAGCKKSGEQSPRASSYEIVLKNMLISNNLIALNQRVSLENNTTVYVFGDTATGTAKSSKGTTASSVTIQLIARMEPP